MGDFDSLQGQTDAFWTGKQEVSSRFRGALCDGAETADDKIRYFLPFFHTDGLSWPDGAGPPTHLHTKRLMPGVRR